MWIDVFFSSAYSLCILGTIARGSTQVRIILSYFSYSYYLSTRYSSTTSTQVQEKMPPPLYTGRAGLCPCGHNFRPYNNHAQLFQPMKLQNRRGKKEEKKEEAYSREEEEEAKYIYRTICIYRQIRLYFIAKWRKQIIG